MKKLFGIVFLVATLFAGTMSVAGAEEGQCREGMFTHSSWLAPSMASVASELYAETGVAQVQPLNYTHCEELTVVFSGWSVMGVAWQPWMTQDGVVTALRADLESASDQDVSVNIQLEPLQDNLLQAMMWYDSFMHRDVEYTARISHVSVQKTELGLEYDVYLQFTGFLGDGQFIPVEVWNAIHADQ